MSKDTFDAVLASTPVNAATARVMGKGEHWNPKLKDEPEHTKQEEQKQSAIQITLATAAALVES